jgi:hypothetical protein
MEALIKVLNRFESVEVCRPSEQNRVPGPHPALAGRRQSSTREFGSRSANRCRDPRGIAPEANGTLRGRHGLGFASLLGSQRAAVTPVLHFVGDVMHEGGKLRGGMHPG